MTGFLGVCPNCGRRATVDDGLVTCHHCERQPPPGGGGVAETDERSEIRAADVSEVLG